MQLHCSQAHVWSQFSGRDIQQLVIGAGIAGKSVAARSAAAAALYDSASLLQLPSVSHWRPGNLQAALAPVSGSGDFAEAVAAAQAGGAHLLLVALAGDQPAAPVQFDAAACKDSDRTGLRVTASILEGLGVTLMLSIFTALGLAALYCIATPTRLLEKNVPVGREH